MYVLFYSLSVCKIAAEGTGQSAMGATQSHDVYTPRPPRDSQELSDLHASDLRKIALPGRGPRPGGEAKKWRYQFCVLQWCEEQTICPTGSPQQCPHPCILPMVMTFLCCLGIGLPAFGIWQCMIREDRYFGKGLLDGDGGDCSK